MAESLPKSAMERSLELVGLAAKLGQKELGKKLSALLGEAPALKKLQSQVDQAQVLVESLGRLKGAAMKAGQLLSLEARDFLPPEVIEVLEKLQDSGKSMDFAVVERLLSQELGPCFAEIQDLSPKPLASASIGQVHRARFRGQEVALKVQFPGVSEGLSTDLFLLRKLSEGFLRMSGRHMNLDDLFAELGQMLRQEVDYIQEATFMEEYATQVTCSHPLWRQPQPVCELTTGRVLGMTLQKGLRVEDWIRLQPSLEERRHFASLYLELFVQEFFEAGLVQTDPNFGNFLIQPESRSLVILDFGALRRFTPEFRGEYLALLKSLQANHAEEILQRSVDIGLIDPREDASCREDFLKMLHLSLQPFAGPQPFDFGDVLYSQEMRQRSTAFLKKIRFSPPPHKIVFLHRKLGGVYRFLQTLNLQMDLRPYWDSILAKELSR